MNARILVVDDDLGFANSIKSLLKKNGMSVWIANDPAEALKSYSVAKMDFDLLLIDYSYKNSDVTGADLAEIIKKRNPQQAFLFMSGFDDKNFLKSMLKVGGAKNFIEKGDGPEVFIRSINEILSESGVNIDEIDCESEEIQFQRESDIRALGLIGRSKELHAVVKQVENYRKFKSRFLILGPTGSGKELIAKAFQVAGKPFYAVDCTRFSEGQEQFLESELYGHKKGAYTGADQDKRGAFEIANGGVIFLDELHCLSLKAQSKLLRTLQEMKFRRLGDTTISEISFDASIVAAAKPELLTMVKSGEFKEDLYYRLAKSEIRIPALRDRISDIRPLAHYFTEKYSKKHNISKVLHPMLLKNFESYSWPGNVRELEGIIENLIMSSKEEIVGPELFYAYVKQKEPTEHKAVPINANLKLTVEAVESDHILDALRKSRFIGGAAELLGIPRTTLNDKIKKFNIDPYQYLQTEGV